MRDTEPQKTWEMDWLGGGPNNAHPPKLGKLIGYFKKRLVLPKPEII